MVPPPYDGDNRRQNEPWHIKREINVAHMFTTISAIVVVGIFISKQDTRISLAEQAIQQQRQERIEQKIEARDALTDIKADIKALGTKLERLLERR